MSFSWDRNTAGLKKNAQKKSLETFAKAEEGIRQLLRSGKPINFESVANAAGVSRAWLYKQPKLKERINHLRQQASSDKQVPKRQRASDESKNAMIAALKQQIKELRVDNQAMKQQLEIAYGLAHESNATYLAKEVERLSEELEKAKVMFDQLISKNQEEVEEGERLREKNQELSAQVLAIESLETKNRNLERQNKHLMKRLTQAQAEERAKTQAAFEKARLETGE